MGQFVGGCSWLPPGRKINCESEKVVSVFFFPGDRSNHGVFPTQLDLSHPPSPTTTTLGTADHTSLPFRVSTNWLRLLEREVNFHRPIINFLSHSSECQLHASFRATCLLACCLRRTTRPANTPRCVSKVTRRPLKSLTLAPPTTNHATSR